MSLCPRIIRYRKKNNLCPICGLPNVEGRSFCEQHLNKETEREKNKRLGRKNEESFGWLFVFWLRVARWLYCGRKCFGTNYCNTIVNLSIRRNYEAFHWKYPVSRSII